MRTTDRAQRGALALLAAGAATASVGVAALARAGAALCGHRVLVHHHAEAMGGVTMGAGSMAAAVPPADGVCPILLLAAAAAAAVCLLAVVVLVASRAGAPAVLVAAARWIAAIRVGPLTGGIGLAAAIPLVAILANEGNLRELPALSALALLLLAGAFVSALAFAGAARVVLGFARRLAVAIAAAFRLLVPGAGAPWALRWEPVLVPARIGSGRRRPSRAPPVLR